MNHVFKVSGHGMPNEERLEGCVIESIAKCGGREFPKSDLKVWESKQPFPKLYLFVVTAFPISPDPVELNLPQMRFKGVHCGGSEVARTMTSRKDLFMALSREAVGGDGFEGPELGVAGGFGGGGDF